MEPPSQSKQVFATHRAPARWLARDPLLQNRNFMQFWTSSALTSFGSQISMLALPLTAVTLLGASPAQMGVMVALETIPFALFSLHAGVWIDRNRKLPILLASQILIGLILLTVPALAWYGRLSMGYLYCVAFTLGLSFVVTGTAAQVFLTQLVGRTHLIDALARFTGTDSAAKLVGPGVAGSLIHWLGAPFAIAFDAFAFFISYFLLRKIRTDETRPALRDDSTMWNEIKEGWQVVRESATLWSLAIGAALWQLLFQGYQALVMIFAARDLGLGAGQIGAAHMIGGIGALLAAVSAKRITRRLGMGPPILIGLGITALAWLVLAVIPGGKSHAFVTLAGSLALLDFGITLYVIHYLSLRQAVTPDALLGRMTATMRFLSVAAAPLGALLAGQLGEHFGLRTALAACGIGCTVLFIALWSFSPVRAIRATHFHAPALQTQA